MNNNDNVIYKKKILSVGIATLIAIIITCSSYLNGSLNKKSNKDLEKFNDDYISDDTFTLYNANDDFLYIDNGNVQSYYGRQYITFERSLHVYAAKDNYYDLINEYIANNNISKFCIDTFVVNDLDFSQIDMEYLTSLTLNMRNEKKDICNDLSVFGYRDYKEIELLIDESTNMSNIYNLLSSLDLTKTYVNLNLASTMSVSSVQKCLNLFSDFSIWRLDVMVGCNPNLLDFSNIVANSFNINLFNPEDSINYKFDLNDCVSNFNLVLFGYDNKNIKLKNITVNSNNGDLFTYIGLPFWENVCFDISEANIKLPNDSFCRIQLQLSNEDLVDSQMLLGLSNIGVLINVSDKKSRNEIIYFNENLYIDKDNVQEEFEKRAFRHYIEMYDYNHNYGDENPNPILKVSL